VRIVRLCQPQPRGLRERPPSLREERMSTADSGSRAEGGSGREARNMELM